MPDNYISNDLIFDEIVKELGLNERAIETFKVYYATLQQAAPRLCQNKFLLAVALGDIYHGGHVAMEPDGRAVRDIRLTMKHIAHCASVERTLTSNVKT